ncbi:MAG TPA: hypothetical protein VGM82_12300 [Gemmatimonadaceae bacterium]
MIPPEPGFACILLNGNKGIYGKLSSYTTDDLEMLEVWPPQTELSGTAIWYFYDPHCKPIGILRHPLYFVLWFKNR